MTIPTAGPPLLSESLEAIRLTLLSGSPTVKDGKVFFGCGDGWITVNVLPGRNGPHLHSVVTPNGTIPIEALLGEDEKVWVERKVEAALIANFVSTRFFSALAGEPRED